MVKEQKALNWEVVSRPYEDLHRTVGIFIDGGVPHTISGYFSGPLVEQYPEFIEACSEERGIGYRYTASHFKTFEDLDAIVPEGMVLLVDYFGEELVPRAIFFQMVHAFALRALDTESSQGLSALASLPPDWRSRIESTLPKLEALVEKENT